MKNNPQEWTTTSSSGKLLLIEIPHRTLTLRVDAKYFEQIRSGEKTQDFRLVKTYWTTRIANRQFEWVLICKGYPSKDDFENRLWFPWRGYELKTITHEKFGSEPVDVYAVNLFPLDIFMNGVSVETG